MTTTDGLLAQTLREEAGPLVASRSRRFRDFDLAEEAVQSAVAEASRRAGTAAEHFRVRRSTPTDLMRN